MTTSSSRPGKSQLPQDPDTLGNDLGPDAVAGDDSDPIGLFHSGTSFLILYAFIMGAAQTNVKKPARVGCERAQDVL